MLRSVDHAARVAGTRVTWQLGARLHASVAAVCLLVAAALAVWTAGRWSVGAVVLFGGAALWLIASELWLRLRLQRLAEQARRLAGETELPQIGRPADPVAGLSALHTRLEALLAREEAALRDESQRRVRAEEELLESRERYALAVSGANDGMWEWNYKTRRAYFSPRAKSMLGYAEDEIGDGVEEWRSRIHPQDLERAMTELRAHLKGQTSRFEFEHRMRHRDGSWRWILARAAVVRHASGKPDRLIGLYTDITPRKQVQQVLLDLADGLDGLHGQAVYAALVQRFASIVGVSEAFLCECCDQPATRVRMLAHWSAGSFAPHLEFDLAGTPCAEVIASGQPLLVAQGVGERWPGERPFGIESYVGLPCVDTRGTVIGHIACRHEQRISPELPHQAILKLFAVRASVEMERRVLETLRPGMTPGPGAPCSTTLH
jgi:PAS domain S-box-containing protein